MWRGSRDLDADGFGDPSSTVLACTQPAGLTRTGGDCNDTNSRVNPGAPELLKGIDDDCDAQVDEGFAPPPTDTTAPLPPTNLSIVPNSPSSDLTPTITGVAEPGATIRVFSSLSCQGSPLAITTAAGGTFSVDVLAQSNSSNVFTLQAIDQAFNVSTCSSPISYVAL